MKASTRRKRNLELWSNEGKGNRAVEVNPFRRAIAGLISKPGRTSITLLTRDRPFQEHLPVTESHDNPETPEGEAAPGVPDSGVEVVAQPPRRPRIGWKIRVVVYSVPILILAAIAIPNFVRARTTACKSACIANLRQLDGAKQQWAMDHKKQATDVPTEEDVKSVMKNGQMPVCPAGGKYTLNAVNADPACSLANSTGKDTGHKL